MLCLLFPLCPPLAPVTSLDPPALLPHSPLREAGWGARGEGLPEVEVGRQGEALEVGKVDPGTPDRAWASQSPRREERGLWG